MLEHRTVHAVGRPRHHLVFGAAAGAAALGWGITSYRLRHALTDEHTGLPTRRRWMAAVQRRLRWRLGSLRVVLLDLDKFKPINDEHGHEVGNFVLWETGQRLARALPHSRITRLHGDEFAAMVTQPTSTDIRDLKQALSEPVDLPGAWLPAIDASVGSVVVSSRSGATASSALHAADQQMYLAKRARQRDEPCDLVADHHSRLPCCPHAQQDHTGNHAGRLCRRRRRQDR